MSTGQPQKSRKRPFPRRRTATRNSGQQKNGDSSSTGPTASEITDPRRVRKDELREILNNAMRNLKDKGADWARDSPEISAAEAELNEAMTLYVDGEVDILAVKAKYQVWGKLHL